MTADENWPEFADPRIRSDYEAALGAFLVAFNEIEASVNDLIYFACVEMKAEPLAALLVNSNFPRRLDVLRALRSRFSFLPDDTVFNEIKCLSKERNFFAHGQFDQNPFEGSYEIATERGRRPISVKQLREFTTRAEAVFGMLSYAEASFEFTDEDVESDT